jgi:hypothetical protein
MWEVEVYAPLQATAFNPTSLISGGGGFYRADIGVSQSAGAVSAWADQSGFGNTLTQSTGAKQPTWSATGFNGFPSVRFVAANSTFLTNTAFNFSTSSTVSWFGALVESTAVNERMISFIASGDGNDFANHSMVWATGGTAPVMTYSAFNVNVGNGGSAFSGFSLNTAVLFGFTLDGSGNGNMWINGSIQGAATSNPGGSLGVNPNKLDMGIYAGDDATQPMDGHVIFFGMTQRVMNQTDFTNLKGWSNANFGTNF